jgi:hypothetical protein
MVSRALVVSLLLLFTSAPAFAVEKPAGPYLFDLMKQPAYRAAWTAMLAGETVPAWVEDYAKTLDGPATPSIDIPVGDDAYTLAFTCKAHDCGDNQLYVLFTRSGAKAWGLLLTGAQRKWLGAPDQAIQDAILSGIE